VTAAVLTGAGRALPTTIDQDAAWDGFFADHYAGVRAAQRVFAASGVRRRHAVANPLDEDISGWSTGARMQRYVQEALPLGKQAVAAALDDAGLAPGDVGLFAVATCTGYATPGLDIRLASDLGMPPGLQRLLVGHMGCYAALPGLAAVGDYVTARSRPAVLLCCELTSLHVQPPVRELDQVVAHALFSDAAAAVVLQPGRAGRGQGRRLAGVVARTDPSTADHMTWDVTDLGFRMGLSPRVPDVLSRHVGDVVEELLTGAGLRMADVAGWAVHPGGPRILDVVRDQLGLTEEQVGASRSVLAEHGNCSSATVLLVLEELADVDGPVVVMAFGPGLTLYAALLLPA
jgi:predicted naringenin-chalcone synthase